MKFYKFFLLAFFYPTAVEAQVLHPSDYEEDYHYLIRQQNWDRFNAPITYFPTTIYHVQPDSSLRWDLWNSAVRTSFDEGVGKLNLVVLNPKVNYTYNSTYPRGFNDGPVWRGKGHNMDFTGGFYGSVGILYFTFAPVVTYAQNQDFFIPPTDGHTIVKSPFSFPFEGRIDWVVRYGNSAYYDFHPGQSEVRIIKNNFTIGLSTANVSLGPSRFNPIVLSKNAAGFPHLDVGTNRPARTRLGDFEFRMLWGTFTESDYFDDDSSNDRRYITGISLGYRPKFVEGLSLAVNRVLYTGWSGNLKFRDFFASLTQNTPGIPGQGNDKFDQIGSVTIDWHFPAVGFQTYIEYARNDFPGSIMEFFEQPDRSRARTIGIVKDVDLKNGDLLQFIYESTVLGANQVQLVTGAGGGNPTYYVHSVIANGYTSNGQVLGAGIGPGSQSDIIKIYRFRPSGRYGLHLSRIRLDDDYFVNAYAGTQLFEPYPTDYEVSVGLDWLKFYEDFSLHTFLLYSHRRNFLYQDDEEIHNVQLNLKLTYFVK